MKVKNRVDKKTGIYSIGSGLASGLAFSKVLFLAGLIPKTDFASYIIIFPLGTFLGTILSFGLIEATHKKFPLLWQENKQKTILETAWYILIKILKRGILLIPIIALLFYYTIVEINFINIFYCFVTLTITSVFSLISGLSRATGDLYLILKIVLLRSILSFFIVIITVVFFYTWKTFLIAEIFAQIFTVIIAFSFCNQKFKRSSLGVIKPRFHLKKEFNNGRIVFFAFIIGVIPIYMDKWIIGLSLDSDNIAKYGIMFSIIQLGFVLNNIFAQKVGPEIIKMKDVDITLKKRHLYKWLLNHALVIVIMFFTLLLIYLSSIFSFFFTKYLLTLKDILIISILASMQITGLLEFYFLSINKERIIFRGAIINVSVFIFGYIVSNALYSFFLVLFLAKFMQIAYFWGKILKNKF